MSLPVAPKPALRRFHQASWDEPIVFELTASGERGVLPPRAEASVLDATGGLNAVLPATLARRTPLELPELAQMRVLRHYDRLSQENLGADLNVDIGQGTCTMKYSPKVNDQLIATPKLRDLHPLQDPADVQGALRIFHELEVMLCEISGMARASMQTSGGSGAIWANVAMIRAFHEANGEGEQRREVVTTIFSHPSNAAAAKTAGYDVITLYPTEAGYPSLDALKAAIGPRTAALLITNPEDTGIYNPHIAEFVAAVHAVGGLACYDQANANGIMGITRAVDAGFDLCHFNLHKTFSTPHGCGGPGGGVSAVSEKLVPFLPYPLIEKVGERYELDHDRPLSIGKIGPFYGVTPVVARAYAWIRALGGDGLTEVSRIAVLNNNYLLARVLGIPGASAPYAEGHRRIEQVRYSWQELHAETGIDTHELGVRMADYGMHYWSSHHPFVVPQPFTLEPTESYSKAELDEYADTLAEVARQARETPEVVTTAPHRAPIHQLAADAEHDLDDPARWATTWRSYRRKYAARLAGDASA